MVKLFEPLDDFEYEDDTNEWFVGLPFDQGMMELFGLTGKPPVDSDHNPLEITAYENGCLILGGYRDGGGDYPSYTHFSGPAASPEIVIRILHKGMQAVLEKGRQQGREETEKKVLKRLSQALFSD